jgi:hypothetical protein
MKQLLLFPFLSIGILPVTHPSVTGKNISSQHAANAAISNTTAIEFGPQQDAGNSKMQAAVFKAQEYCRAELKDFEFDIHYSVVSAVVYFYGANFKNVEKGNITSSSLQPVKNKMDRCVPGTVVIFDEVKVKGPDKTIRTIQGLSLVLY